MSVNKPSSPYLVGITGGIGAGKSTVCKIFKLFGVPIYSADQEARHLMERHYEVKEKIAGYFGKEAYLDTGRLNSVYIANRIFRHSTSRDWLNQLVHPVVREDFCVWAHQKRQAAYVMYEAALLFEVEAYQSLDFTILVTAQKSLRIERTLQRDPWRSPQMIESIMKTQFSEAKKRRMADVCIRNSSKCTLIPQVIEIQTFLAKTCATSSPFQADRVK